MDKIKQNKNYCVVYKTSVFFVCFLLIFSSLCIGSFADYVESSNGVDFSNQPLPVVDNSDRSASYISDNYLHYGDYVSPYSGNTFALYAGSTVNYTYMALYNDRTYGSVDTDVDDAVFCLARINTSDNTVEYTKQIDLNFVTHGNVISNSDLNVNGVSWNALTNLTVPVYSSDTDMYASFRYMLDNPPDPPITPHGIDYSLPAGNVLVLDITNLNPTIYLTMDTPTLEFQVTSTQYCGVLSEIPNPINLPLSGTTPINWQAVGKKDTFGRSSSWGDTQVVSGITSDHNHAYFVVANPFSNNYTSANGSELVANPNTTIRIRATNVNNGKIYQLNESFNAGTSNNTQAGDTMSVTYNDSTGLWDTINDTTGEADAPVYGGNNQGQTAITSVTEWLENISNKISSFFTGPINAVGTLVGAGSNFFRTLSGLYSWLPSPVLSVLTSALIVVITVGVIKVFI